MDDNYNKLQHYADELNEKQRLEAVRSTSIITKEAIESKSNRQISATAFRTYYADYFNSKFNNKPIDEKIDKAKFKEWMYIAGGPFREVDLLDNNLKVVDTVPAFYLQPKDSDVIDNPDRLVDEFLLYEKKEKFHKDSALRRVTEEVKSVKVEINNDLDRKEHLNKWLNITKKYSNTINMEINDVNKKDVKNLDKSVKDKLGITDELIDDIEY